ncbi:lysozyme [Phenylobacterium sp.]|uniref:lysozyme n=1 Tax=Phenylobacterium sp. TaxID=1871053 RepID=UPI0035AE382F
MTPRHQVSRAAIELTKRFEGYRRKAAQLPDGRWTIGYGHTLTARQGAEVSESDAEALLLYDLLTVSKAVNELTFTPLTQNQFDALCAFAFNIGLLNFRRSRVLKLVNEGALIQAACSMELWRKAEFEGEVIVIDALVRRRSAEKTLFLTPPNDGWVPVPSAILKPDLDEAAEALVPAEPPAPVVTSLDGEAVRVLRADEAAPPPVPPETHESPVTAAAEAVTARLATVFKDETAELAPPSEARLETLPESEPAIAPAPEPAIAEPAPEEARPQADFAPPISVEALHDQAPAAAPLAAPAAEAFELAPPPEDAPAAPDAAEPESTPATAADAQPGADLFAPPMPANDEAADAPAEPAREGERVVIDDLAPFDFAPTPVQPLRKPKEGYLSLVSLAVLGLAFFAGGLFWAVNAQAAGGEPAWMTPKVVGALACVAGVGFFSIALFLLLQRLGQAAERGDPEPRG